MKRILTATALMAALLLPASAFAGHVSVGVGINLGGPGYYAPPPVVYEAPPAPVYYYDPPPVVYAPLPVVYGPPVAYRPYYQYPRCWWDNGYRVCR